MRASDTAARQETLGDLLGQIGYVKGEAGVPGMPDDQIVPFGETIM